MYSRKRKEGELMLSIYVFNCCCQSIMNSGHPDMGSVGRSFGID